jgi:hypothetical protein
LTGSKNIIGTSETPKRRGAAWTRDKAEGQATRREELGQKE